MDKKEVVAIYDEEAVDRALADLAMWCTLHKGEFLGDAWAAFEALCGDEVSFDGCEGIVQTMVNLAFTEWVMFDSKVFGRGCIDEYLDRVESVLVRTRRFSVRLRALRSTGFSATTVFSMTVSAIRGLSSPMSSKGAASRSTAPI